MTLEAPGMKWDLREWRNAKYMAKAGAMCRRHSVAILMESLDRSSLWYKISKHILPYL